jgi:hypothetical protein
MSNRRAHRRWRASRVRHESRWGRRAGEVQRRPAPVKQRSARTIRILRVKTCPCGYEKIYATTMNLVVREHSAVCVGVPR